MTSAKSLHGDLAQMKELIESNHIRPVIDKSYPFDEIHTAHHFVEQEHKVGNVVIKIQ